MNTLTWRPPFPWEIARVRLERRVAFLDELASIMACSEETIPCELEPFRHPKVAPSRPRFGPVVYSRLFEEAA